MLRSLARSLLALFLSSGLRARPFRAPQTARRSSSSHRLLRHFLDVVIIACALAVGWRFVNVLAPEPPTPSFTPVLGLGDELALAGIDWSQSRRTVLLFASTTCPACRESAPFYRELARRVMPRSSIRFFVAAEEPVSTTRAWLNQEKIHPDEVVHVQSPLSFGFFVTPTLVIADQDGRVRDIVIGKVSAKVQEQLWARMSGSEDVAPIDNVYASHEIDDRELELLQHRTPLQILDVRSRDAYATGHRPGAYNIPGDELSTRAPIELSADRAIVVDCGTQSSWICRSTTYQLRQLLGFDNVYMLIASR